LASFMKIRGTASRSLAAELLTELCDCFKISVFASNRERCACEASSSRSHMEWELMLFVNLRCGVLLKILQPMWLRPVGRRRCEFVADAPPPGRTFSCFRRVGQCAGFGSCTAVTTTCLTFWATTSSTATARGTTRRCQAIRWVERAQCSVRRDH
jgi:hypothetical protein